MHTRLATGVDCEVMMRGMFCHRLGLRSQANTLHDGNQVMAATSNLVHCLSAKGLTGLSKDCGGYPTELRVWQLPPPLHAGALARHWAGVAQRQGDGGVVGGCSPAVPPVEAVRGKIKSFVDTGILGGHPERLWINPDCGLKVLAFPPLPLSTRACLEPATGAKRPVYRGIRGTARALSDTAPRRPECVCFCDAPLSGDPLPTS